jgi:hypothetical protein
MGEGTHVDNPNAVAALYHINLVVFIVFRVAQSSKMGHLQVLARKHPIILSAIWR